MESLGSSPQGSAQFYVFVGVIVFLYCLAALVLYLFFDEQYKKHNYITIAVSIYTASLPNSTYQSIP